MVGVEGSIGAPIYGCRLRKGLGYSNCYEISMSSVDPIKKRNPIFIRSLNEGSPDIGLKIEGTRSQKKNQILMPRGSKQIQKVSAFGPAHAEQALKLYQMKRTQREENLHCFEKPYRSYIKSGRRISTSNHDKAQVSTSEVNNVPKDPVHYEQRMIYRNSKVEQLAFHSILKENQSMVRIAKITPRPDRACGRNPKDTMEAGTIGNSRERFEKEEPFKFEDNATKSSMHNYLTDIKEVIDLCISNRVKFLFFVRI